MSLDYEQRQGLKRLISRASRALVPARIESETVRFCDGCGIELDTDRRYCTRACANRHWHVRKRGGRDRRV